MAGKQIKLVAFAGSTRSSSLNKLLVKIAAEGAETAGAVVSYIDLRDYPLPLYDGDYEADNAYPENALALKELFKAHGGFLIASPEYNSGYSAVLKNTLDWVSRPAVAGEPSLVAFSGKYASLMAAAPGALGGLRGLYQVRELLMNMGVFVLPKMHALNFAMKAFDENGHLKDADTAKIIEQLGAQTVTAIN